MDAAGSERAALLAWGESTGATMFFAATDPERTTSLVLVNPYSRYARSESTPWGLPAEMILPYVSAIEEVWGTGAPSEILAPTLVCSEGARRRWARIERLTASPDVLAATTRAVLESDVTHVLPAIQAPTLVITRRGDGHVRHEHGRHVASQINGARLVELPGDDHVPFAGRTEQILDEVEEFLTGSRPIPESRSCPDDRPVHRYCRVNGTSGSYSGDRRWREHSIGTTSWCSVSWSSIGAST